MDLVWIRFRGKRVVPVPVAEMVQLHVVVIMKTKFFFAAGTASLKEKRQSILLTIPKG